MKRLETSKKILVASWASAIIITTLLVIFPIYGLPTDGLEIAVPLAWAEVTAANGFYLWKAKNENRAKFAQKFIEEFADKYGAEIAAQIAEIVLKD